MEIGRWEKGEVAEKFTKEKAVFIENEDKN